jgi:hypothetical protein
MWEVIFAVDISEVEDFTVVEIAFVESAVHEEEHMRVNHVVVLFARRKQEVMYVVFLTYVVRDNFHLD